LAQAYGRSVEPFFPPLRLMAVDAIAIIAQLHGDCLRFLCEALGAHHAGLAVAARRASAAGLVDSKMHRRLARLDAAFAVARHVTSPYAAALRSELSAMLAPNSPHSFGDLVKHDEPQVNQLHGQRNPAAPDRKDVPENICARPFEFNAEASPFEPSAHKVSFGGVGTIEYGSGDAFEYEVKKESSVPDDARAEGLLGQVDPGASGAFLAGVAETITASVAEVTSALTAQQDELTKPTGDLAPRLSELSSDSVLPVEINTPVPCTCELAAPAEEVTPTPAEVPLAPPSGELFSSFVATLGGQQVREAFTDAPLQATDPGVPPVLCLGEQADAPAVTTPDFVSQDMAVHQSNHILSDPGSEDGLPDLVPASVFAQCSVCGHGDVTDVALDCPYCVAFPATRAKFSTSPLREMSWQHAEDHCRDMVMKINAARSRSSSSAAVEASMHIPSMREEVQFLAGRLHRCMEKALSEQEVEGADVDDGARSSKPR